MGELVDVSVPRTDFNEFGIRCKGQHLEQRFIFDNEKSSDGKLVRSVIRGGKNCSKRCRLQDFFKKNHENG